MIQVSYSAATNDRGKQGNGPWRIAHGALEATDWNVLYELHGENIDGITDCVSEYTGFCNNYSIPIKQVHCYPNNNPWFTSYLKALLHKKKKAFIQYRRPGGVQSCTEGTKTETERESKDYNRKILEKKLQKLDTLSP